MNEESMYTSAAELITNFQSRGFTFAERTGALAVDPRDKLTERDRAEIGAWKSQILDELSDAGPLRWFDDVAYLHSTLDTLDGVLVEYSRHIPRTEWSVDLCVEMTDDGWNAMGRISQSIAQLRGGVGNRNRHMHIYAHRLPGKIAVTLHSFGQCGLEPLRIAEILKAAPDPDVDVQP